MSMLRGHESVEVNGIQREVFFTRGDSEDYANIPPLAEIPAVNQHFITNRRGPRNWDAYWLGVQSEKEMRRRIDEGWPEGGEMLRELVEGLLTDTPYGMRRTLVRRDTGDEIEVDYLLDYRYDEMWRTTERKPKIGGKRTLNLVSWWGGNAGLDQEAMMAGAAAGCAVADVLEREGYSVNFDAICISGEDCSTSSENLSMLMMNAKRAGEPIVLDALAGAVAHPAIIRWLGWQQMGATCTWPIGSHAAYPLPRLLADVVLAMGKTRLLDEPDVLLPSITTMNEARALVKQVIEMLPEFEQAVSEGVVRLDNRGRTELA